MRKSWDEYYMEIANVVATRSTCLKYHVGAVLVRDNRILGTGYNGPPAKMPHCDELNFCEARERARERIDNHCVKAVHAELNAILHCALHGVSTKDAVLYTTTFPCLHCTLMLINAGIKRIVYLNDYYDNRGDQRQLLANAGIEVVKL